MNKREASFQSIFNQYLRKKKLHGYFELKQTTTDSIPFSDFKDHQLEGLIAAENNGFVWKLSDEDSRQKPFDCISAPRMRSFVVIRYPKRFYIIPVFAFLQAMDESKRKSLVESVAQEICWNDCGL